MQYRVSVTASTPGTRLKTYIRADNRDAANTKAKEYNERHPDWDLQLLDTPPCADDAMMPVEYYREES